MEERNKQPNKQRGKGRKEGRKEGKKERKKERKNLFPIICATDEIPLVDKEQNVVKQLQEIPHHQCNFRDYLSVNVTACWLHEFNCFCLLVFALVFVCRDEILEIDPGLIHRAPVCASH